MATPEFTALEQRGGKFKIRFGPAALDWAPATIIQMSLHPRHHQNHHYHTCIKHHCLHQNDQHEAVSVIHQPASPISQPLPLTASPPPSSQSTSLAAHLNGLLYLNQFIKTALFWESLKTYFDSNDWKKKVRRGYETDWKAVWAEWLTACVLERFRESACAPSPLPIYDPPTPLSVLWKPCMEEEGS